MRFKEFSGEWKKIRLGSIIEEIKTYTSDFNKYPLYSFTIENGVTPKTDRYERNFLVTKDGDTFKIVPPNSFVMNPMNLRFGAINYSKVKIPVSVSGYYNIFEIENGKNNEFWSAYFLTKTAINLYNSVATGSLIEKKRVHFSQFIQLSFYVPSDVEKQKITRFLQLIENRIAVQNKIISDLKVLKKELCNRYFKSVHNDMSLGYITLKDILTERKEYCSKDGTYTHGTLSKEGVSPKTERYDRDFLVKNEDKQYKVTHFNDICYNPANLKFGVICRNTYGDLIFSPIYVTFEIADTVYPAYIELFLTNANFIGRIRRYEQGTVYERMAVSSEDFLSYETRMPTYEDQVKFADKIQRIQDKIELETSFLNYLQKQRKYFLNAMFI